MTDPVWSRSPRDRLLRPFRHRFRQRFRQRFQMGLPVALLAILAAPGAGAAQSSTEELAARLESRDPATRRQAAADLAADGSAAAISALTGATEDEEAPVRRAVLEALLSFRHPDAAPGIVAFLDDPDRGMRREAIRGLVEMHAREPQAGFRRRAVNWLMNREGEVVLDPLRPVSSLVQTSIAGRLEDEDAGVRRVAAEALGALRAREAVAALAAAASDPESEVRTAAVAALAATGSPEAGDALVALLGDEAMERQALLALGALAHPPAGEALLAIYDEDPGSERGRIALRALARAGHPGGRAVFLSELGSRDPARRQYAVEGLAGLDDSGIVDGLTRDFLREREAGVQLAYAYALARLGETPFVDRVVLSFADANLGAQARRYALGLGAEWIPEFERYLSDPDRAVRLSVIELLERLGDPTAIPALVELGDDADAEVGDRARLAARRLTLLRERSAVPEDGASGIASGPAPKDPEEVVRP